MDWATAVEMIEHKVNGVPEMPPLAWVLYVEADPSGYLKVWYRKPEEKAFTALGRLRVDGDTLEAVNA